MPSSTLAKEMSRAIEKFAGKGVDLDTSFRTTVQAESLLMNRDAEIERERIDNPRLHIFNFTRGRLHGILTAIFRKNHCNSLAVDRVEPDIGMRHKILGVDCIGDEDRALLSEFNPQPGSVEISHFPTIFGGKGMVRPGKLSYLYGPSGELIDGNVRWRTAMGSRRLTGMNPEFLTGADESAKIKHGGLLIKRTHGNQEYAGGVKMGTLKLINRRPKSTVGLDEYPHELNPELLAQLVDTAVKEVLAGA